MGIEFVLFRTVFSAALFLQGIMTAVNGAALSVMKLLLNVIPFGQWLLLSPIGYHEARMSLPLLLLISAAMLSGLTVLGIKLIEKKDIK